MNTRPSPHASAAPAPTAGAPAAPHLHGFPYATVELDRNGAPVHPVELRRAMSELSAIRPSDVLILVHGWNATRSSAEDRYGRYLGHARTLMDGPLAQDLQRRQFAVIGLVWPSIPESLQSPASASMDDVRAAAQEAFPHDAELLGAIESGQVVDREQVKRLIDRVTESEIFAQDPDLPERNLDRTALRGEAPDLGSLWRDIVVWASYYEMRERAGRIGEGGGRGLVRDIQKAAPNAKVHLLGHSFGARLAASVARGPDGDPPLKLASLHLIQGAFSHFGFGVATDQAPQGYFRPVVTNRVVTGPILVTHTEKDLALRILYTLASTFAGHDRNFTDAHRFGAIGVNGALNAGAQPVVLNADAPLSFRNGQIYNLQSDAVIPNHGDVEQLDVVRAVLRGISVT